MDESNKGMPEDKSWGMDDNGIYMKGGVGWSSGTSLTAWKQKLEQDSVTDSSLIFSFECNSLNTVDNDGHPF